MKRIFLTLACLVAGVTLVHAQGFLQFYSPAAGIETNTAPLGSGLNLVSGKMLGGAGSYDFALLATTNTSVTANPLDPNWNLVTEYGGAQLLGNNFLLRPGGLSGPGGAGGVQVDLAAGVTYDAMLVGWSAGLASTWATIDGDFNDEFADQNPFLFIGITGIGTITPSSAADAGDPLLFPTVFPNDSMVLYGVPSFPEPPTFALTALAGLSLLFLRRRKS